jgi:predicted transcriptional regulator
MPKMNRETLPLELKQNEERVLKALQKKQEQEHIHAPLKKEIGLCYTDVKNETGLNDDLTSKALKSLQKYCMIERIVDSRRYKITEKGSKYFKTKETANSLTTISAKKVDTVFWGADSIVALDAPQMSKAQQRLVMAGTKDIAKAAFDQFYSNMNPENFPDDGRVIYTVVIHLDKAKKFLNSEEGKKYVNVCER